MKTLLLPLLALMTAFGCLGASAVTADRNEIRSLAARMLIVGFKGDSIDNANPVTGYIDSLGVGGIILFDIDLTGTRKLGSRNITSRRQLAALTRQLKELARHKPLIIAADQEGGLVQRLKPAYGYEKLPSAHRLGEIDNLDSTRHYGALMAEQLAEAGINLNLAPELDIHNDSCPVIGRLDRAYSSDPEKIARHASATIDELHKRGIMATAKHFPGHGSAMADSHYGLTDVTATWSRDELIPFKSLIDSGRVDAVMTAHIFNRNIDDELPATLSHKTITELLRNELGYDGLVITDDLYMQGIIDNYSVERALILAINAGADMIIVGNNITTGFEPDRPYRLVDIIEKAVENGEISIDRLRQANRRIESAINISQN